MELVTGIDWDSGSPRARCHGVKGTAVSISVGDMVTRGLPPSQMQSSYARRVTTDLRRWRPVSFNEYAFAFNRPLLDEPAHAAWSFVDGSTRLVVPALALLRALVRPSKALFPYLFRPQSLDDVCGYTSEADMGGRVRVLAPGDPRVMRSPEVVESLSWMYCFPSARRAWGSVYQSAKQGMLNFALPEAVLTLNVRSVRLGANAYVTSLNAVELIAQEEPLPFAQGHPRTIHASAFAKGGQGRVADTGKQRKGLPPFQHLTDQEWHEIGPLLQSGKGLRPEDQRSLLDAILWKFAESVRWEDVKLRLGTSLAKAPTTYSRWKADGRWDAVVTRLSELRQGRSTLESMD